MAGIYLHIPFCKSKCNYCDFYSGTQFILIDEFVSALILEIHQRLDYLNNDVIETIYFGGGTPSVLGKTEISKIISNLYSNFRVAENVEITFESNPDDLSPDYLKDLFSIGINRLSIGLQSFDDNILSFLGRKHTALRAKEVVESAKNIGFDNISVDFIFAIPGLTIDVLKQTLIEIINLGVSHISQYNLTVSNKTKLHWKLIRESISQINEDEAIEQYLMINDFLTENGYEHYEVSNYSRGGAYSRHNMSYWTGKPYLGLGPSAHSYNGNSRQWNLPILKRYIDSIKSGNVSFDIEYLTELDKYNEYIIVNLRTYLGLDYIFVKSNFSADIQHHFLLQVNSLTQNGYFKNIDNIYYPDRNSLIKADFLSRQLMI